MVGFYVFVDLREHLDVLLAEVQVLVQLAVRVDHVVVRDFEVVDLPSDVVELSFLRPNEAH